MFKNILKLSILVILPLLLLTPFLCGMLESLTNNDYRGNGRCMLDNTMKIITTGDSNSRIVIGKVRTEINGEEFDHLWGVDSKGKRIDVTCSGEISRRVVSIIDPWSKSMTVKINKNASLLDKVKTHCNRAYLYAFLTTKNIIAHNKLNPVSNKKSA